MLVRLGGDWLGWLVDNCPMPDLAARIDTGELVPFGINGTDAAVILSVGTTKDTGARALWIASLGGSVGYRAKSNRTLMGAVLEACEGLALYANCTEMRIEAGTRSALKTRLFSRFGFVAHDVLGTTIMRKVL